MSGLEAVGIAASIIQLADLGTKLSVKLFTFYRQVENANQAIQSLSSDVALTCAILRELGESLQEDEHSKLCSAEAYRTAQHVLNQCEEVLKKIRQMINDSVCPAKSRWQQAASKIRNVLNEPNVDLLKDNLERLKSTMLLLLNVIMYAGQIRNNHVPTMLQEQRILIESLLEEKKNSQKQAQSRNIGVPEKVPLKHDLRSKSGDNLSFNQTLFQQSQTSDTLKREDEDGCEDELDDVKEYKSLIRSMLREIDACKLKLESNRHSRIKNGVLNIHSGEIVQFQRIYGVSIFQRFEDCIFEESDNHLQKNQDSLTLQSHRLSLVDSDPSTSIAVPPSPPSSESASQYQENTHRAAMTSSATSIGSLPSIHEALGNDNPLPYPASTSAPPPQPGYTAPPPSHLIGRPGAEGPSGSPKPFSSPPAFPHQPQLQGGSVHPQDSRNASLHSLRSAKSPTQSAKTGISSISESQNSSGYDYSAPTFAGSVASPNGYGHFPPTNYSFQSQPPPNASSYLPVHYDNRPYLGAPCKPGADPSRVEEAKGGFVGRPIPGQPHGDTVKRHLDIYDVETSLNEIAELSNRTLDFSRHYAARAHQTQRSEPVLGSLPTLTEVEDMLHMQRRNQDALIRTRTAVVNQEQVLAEQIAQRKTFKPGGVDADEHMAMYQEEFKGAGGFAGPDAKKRRGKAAPPSRCHSCNRAETPEWYRGQDGSRSLCNVCRLHYAKLAHKMGANKCVRPPGRLETKAPSKEAQRADCLNQKDREKRTLTPTSDRNLKRRRTRDSSSSFLSTPESNNTSPLLEPKSDVPSWILPISFESLLLQWTTLRKQEIQPFYVRVETSSSSAVIATPTPTA